MKTHQPVSRNAAISRIQPKAPECSDVRAGAGLTKSIPVVMQQQGPVHQFADLSLDGAAQSGAGLPERLKAGVERLSGVALDDVRVHYDSQKPGQLQALAYTRGTTIHLGPGQEKHLPHEAWHVVQQKQGRVKPTLQMKGVAINDNVGLEREAGAKGAQQPTGPMRATPRVSEASGSVRGGASIVAEHVGPGRPNLDVVQLAGKDAFAVGHGRDQAAVPDLTDDLENDIRSAHTNAEREKVLKDLYQHLKEKKVVDAALEITVLYIPSGMTEFGEYRPDVNYLLGVMRISSNAFASPAVLYSTIRHELIHAEQYRAHQHEKSHQISQWESQPADKRGWYHLDEKTLPEPGPDDAALYQDPDQGKYNKSVERPFLHAASEMETYHWEITNRARTGTTNVNYIEPKTGKSESYIGNRIEKFGAYWKQCVEYFAKLSRDKKYAAKVALWQPYYDKLTALAFEVGELEQKLPTRNNNDSSNNDSNNNNSNNNNSVSSSLNDDNTRIYRGGRGARAVTTDRSRSRNRNNSDTNTITENRSGSNSDGESKAQSLAHNLRAETPTRGKIPGKNPPRKSGDSKDRSPNR